MSKMFDYKPLVRVLELRGIKNKELEDVLGLSTVVTASFRKEDTPLNLRVIEKLCLYLQIPVEQVISIKGENGESFRDESRVEILEQELLLERTKSQQLEATVVSLEKQIQEMSSSTKTTTKRFYKDRFKINNLAEHRESAGLTQEDLAAHIKTTKQTISYYETGRRYMSELHLERIKEVIDIPETDIEKKIRKTEVEDQE